MRRLLVNDALNQLGEHTFWSDLMEWFDCDHIGGSYDQLSDAADAAADGATLIIRNASYFPPIKASTRVPTISLLQDIFTDGPQRTMQEAVIKSSASVIYNSEFTASKYVDAAMNQVGHPARIKRVIPLPVDFTIFTPQNAMGCQQALGLPDGCVCWIGASQGAAGHVKGFDILLQVARLNPDIPFVCVFKDAAPEYTPPNMRCFVRLPHADLVKVIGACRVGLCTSRTESQHLAGIEMGACGLPMVVPPVGVYWNHMNLPGIVITEPTINTFTAGIRGMLLAMDRTVEIHDYWRKKFDKPVIKAAWEKLVAEVEAA